MSCDDGDEILQEADLVEPEFVFNTNIDEFLNLYNR